MRIFDRLRKLLFDFSEADREREQIERILTTALAESTGEEDFAATLLLVTRAQDWDDLRCMGLLRMMAEYRRMGDYGSCQRALAERLLDDLPRRYGRLTIVDP